MLDRPPPLVLIGRRSSAIPDDIPPNVHLLGPWGHDAIMHAWSGCLFGVVPSVGSEACATVVMEGIASGKAVIATDIGGMPDMIDSGITGILVPPDNAAALAEATRSLLKERKRIGTFGQAALAGVERLKAGAIVPGSSMTMRRCSAVYVERQRDCDGRSMGHNALQYGQAPAWCHVQKFLRVGAWNGYIGDAGVCLLVGAFIGVWRDIAVAPGETVVKRISLPEGCKGEAMLLRAGPDDTVELLRKVLVSLPRVATVSEKD